jgi:S-DNA-T family DNA segregation ATPase FtsK/SpoIIIE
MAKRGRKKKFKLSFNVDPETLRSLLAVILLIFSALALISFLLPSYPINEKIQLVFRKAFGFSSFIFPFLTAISGLLLIDSFKHKIKDFRVFLGLLILLIAVSGFLHVFISVDGAKEAALNGRGGGFVGYIIATNLKRLVSVFGAMAVLLGLIVIAVMLIFNVSIDKVVEFFNEKVKTGMIFKGKKEKVEEMEVKEGLAEFDDEDLSEGDGEYSGDQTEQEESEEASFEILPSLSEPSVAAGVPSDVVTGDGAVGSISSDLPGDKIIWQLPSPELLMDSHSGPPDTGDVEKNKKAIKESLKSFGIPVEIAETQVGPSFTKFALNTPPGVKVAKISNLQNDLALALASPTGSVRVEAPIPGKAQVGIEVPNTRRAIVNFKSLITSDSMSNQKSKLSIVLGTDVGGVTHVHDIAKMPHLLIAGATGSGKSVFIHNLIFSLLFRATPQEVKFILVDPKRVELAHYEDIPHLYTPLVTDIEKAPAVLKWAVSEMSRRYRLFQSAKARNIKAYNEKSGFQALPYVLIVVDELAELIVADRSAVEKSLIRLAQLARATGIHLILATQRPEANVITGLIKANIPCRVAFKVISQVDSRVIIDQPGAEKLLGDGDMLFIPPDTSTPIRLQGAMITDKEIESVVKFLKEQGGPDYKEEILDTPTDEEASKSIAAGGEAVDELYDEAVETVVSAGKGSASLLQRRLSIGYARAARILDELEKNGIVGPPKGSRARDVLVDSVPLPDGEGPPGGEIRTPSINLDDDDFS